LPTQRLFVALELPGNIRESLSDILQKTSEFHEVKWVERENLHLTLLFLGDHPEAAIPGIERGLRPVAEATAPFKVSLGGFDAFPDRRDPKVIFVPVVREEKALSNLVEKLSLSLQRAGIAHDRKPFHGHVTLGRGKTLKGATALFDRLASVCPSVLGEMNVEHFVLFRSQLSKKGPIYTAVENFKIGT